jgi:hypothetical protein
MFLLAIFAVLLPGLFRERAKLVAAMVPAAVIYLLVRFMFLPTANDYFISGTFLPYVHLALLRLWTINGVAWVFMGFDFLWLPIVWVVLRGSRDRTLRRWSLMIPVLLLVSILGGSDHYGRILLLAFPAAIPMAMLGVQRLLDLLEQPLPEVMESVALFDGELVAAEGGPVDHGLAGEVPST